MEITIAATPKEIADLVLALQGRLELKFNSKEIWKAIHGTDEAKKL